MEKGHRIGKFNTLSINVILFQGNQKNIRVGLSGRNNAASGLFTKKLGDFRTIRETKSAICRHARMVQIKSQLFSKSTLNLARSDTKFVAVRKILLSVLWQGSLGSSV